MADLIELAEQWKTELWGRGNLKFAETSCAEDFTDYSLPETEEGDVFGLQDEIAELREAFPDLQITVTDSFLDEDYVTLRANFRGTHRGDYKGFLPTGQTVEWESIEILHFEQELVAERWTHSDLWALLEENDGGFGSLQANAEHAALIAQLAETPKRLRQLVRQSGVKAAAGETWSTGAAIGHLWRSEVEVWQHRLREMADRDNPFWEYWDPQQYDWEAEFGAADIVALLDAYEFRRMQTCNYLRALSEEGWLRRGEHRVFGVLDVAGLMTEALKHDREHLEALSGAQV